MPTQSVSLPPPLGEFVDSRVRSGRYANTDEVVQAGLRLLEAEETEREEKLRRLREAAQVGIADIEAGRFTTMTTVDEIRQHVSEIADRARSDASVGR